MCGACFRCFLGFWVVCCVWTGFGVACLLLDLVFRDSWIARLSLVWGLRVRTLWWVILLIASGVFWGFGFGLFGVGWIFVIFLFVCEFVVLYRFWVFWCVIGVLFYFLIRFCGFCV